jgi:dephospho-CoA kinase
VYTVRLRVGLTGGIGAGKSEAAKAFTDFGALVIDADALARLAVARGSAGLERVRALWPHVVAPDGALDRAALAGVVFREPQALEALNGIIHPFVRARSLELEAAATREQIVIHDVPLLFEAGFYRACDANIVVVAELEARVARLVARGLDTSEIERRMRAQIDPDRARELADYTVPNNGTLEELRTQAREVFDDLLERRPRATESEAS